MKRAFKKLAMRLFIVAALVALALLFMDDMKRLASYRAAAFVVLGVVVGLFLVARGVLGFARHKHALARLTAHQPVGLKRRVERI